VSEALLPHSDNVAIAWQMPGFGELRLAASVFTTSCGARSPRRAVPQCISFYSGTLGFRQGPAKPQAAAVNKKETST
jgi:hypothetical protein